jgi:hypothetical protein
MATQIMIFPNEQVLVDDSFTIQWADQGNAMPSINDDTIHAIVYNDLLGDNEIQHKDPSTGAMTGNTPLASSSDAIGSTTIADLLTWSETRKGQINSAIMDYENTYENAETKWEEDDSPFVEDLFRSFAEGNTATHSYFDWSKTWRDYDENYS